MDQYKQVAQACLDLVCLLWIYPVHFWGVLVYVAFGLCQSD